MDRILQNQESNRKEAILGILLILLLLGVGLTTLYSASYDKALRLGLESNYFFRRQVLFAILGIASAIVIYLVPFSFIRAMVPVLLLSSFTLMLLTSLTPLGETRLGATRWIRFGSLSFQPSELVKVSVILYLSNYLSQRTRIIREFKVATIAIGVIFFSALLIILQRDYSTTMVFLFLSFSILLIGGVKITHLLYYLLLAGVPGVLFLITEEYRLKRVIGFIFKDIDPSGINYQVNLSMDAIASGGFFGKGFGQGIYKLGKLPEVQSDFIFSSFAEEFGLFGVICIILVFFILAYLGYRGAARHRESDHFLYLTGFGITHILIWQVLLNLGVVSGIVPPTGIPLPFFSAGGTNLLMNLGMCGLLIKIISQKEKVIEKNEEKTPQKRVIDFE